MIWSVIRLRYTWIPKLFLLLLIGCVGASIGIAYVYTFQSSRVEQLRVVWQKNGTLRLVSVSDGPFVVTHLTVYGTTEADKAVCTFTQPIAIVDSKGYSINTSEWRALVWRSAITQQIAKTPTIGSSLRALYYRPLVAEYQGGRTESY